MNHRRRLNSLLNKAPNTKSKRSQLRKLLVEQLEDRRVLATAIVTTATDNLDSGIAVGAAYSIDWLNTHKGPDGAISLREAIIAANNTDGLDSISFNISSGGSTGYGGYGGFGGGLGGTISTGAFTILVGSTGLGALPIITSPITINGYTQLGSSANTNTSGSNASIQVGLDGTSAGASANGLELGTGSDGSTIRGLAIQKFGGSGVQVNSAINVIAGNFIGLNEAGISNMANAYGVTIASAINNTIGGPALADRNVISANTSAGIRLQNAANSNTISGNLLGQNASAYMAIPNAVGITIINSNNNTIGGTASTARNTITGSTTDGVSISGTSNGNSVLGNSIFGNTRLGINLAVTGDPASGLTVNDGAKPAATPNLSMDTPVISSASYSGSILNLAGYVGSAANQSLFANSRVEFFVNDNSLSPASGKTYIGFLTTNATGGFSGSLNLSTNGITLYGSEKIIASATDATGNTSEFGPIASLTQAPSFAVSADQTTAIEAGGVDNGTAGTNPAGNVLTNDIGSGNSVIGVQAGSLTSATGGVAVAVNGSYGTITVSATGQFTYTLNNSLAAVQALKSTTTTLSDIFTYTARSSSYVMASTQITVLIQGANDTPTITSNGGGATANLSINENVTAVTTVAATDVDAATTTNYLIAGGADASKFVINATTGALSFVTAPDFEAPTDVGANRVYDVIVQASDGALSMTQSLAVTILDVADALIVTTFADNNDSGITTNATQTITWLNANKGADGLVSLREAIIAANNTVGTDSIAFNIAGTGLKTISVGSTGLGALPAITSPLDINGYSQSGSSQRTATAAAVLNVLLNGTSAGATANGLLLSTGSSGSTIRGLVIDNFATSAIQLASSNNLVLGNIIGLNATATTAQPNGKGVFINGVSGNTIGGSTVAAPNIIAGNTTDGVNIDGTNSTGNLVLANSIYNNGRIGINLIATTDTSTGVTANDGLKSAGKPNMYMDSAVFSTASLSGNQLTVGGYVGSAANQSLFASSRVDIYVNESSTTKNTGRVYLGSLTASANGSFSGTIDVTGKGVLAADKLTATATDTSNNTSEFGNQFDVNVAPVAVSDTAIALEQGGVNNGTPGINPSGNVLTNDSELDAGDTFSVAAVAAGVSATPTGPTASPVTGTYGSISIQATGAFTYQLNNTNAAVQALRTTADTLTDVFSYSVRDALNATSVTQLTITIQGANDNPTISAISNQSISEDGQAGPISFTVSDVDTPLNDLVFTGTSSNVTVVTTAGIVTAGTGANRTVTVTPMPDISGVTTVTVKATDSAIFSQTSFTLTVASANDAPVLDNALELQFTPVNGLDPSDVGNTVAEILASRGSSPITDTDAFAQQGIALWNAQSNDGIWQYSVDQATNWISVSVVSTSAALLLRPTDRLRYVPLTESVGVYPISFYAWDQTSSQGYGNKVNATTRGGTTSFSVNSAVAKVSVSNLPILFTDDGESGFATTGTWTQMPIGRLVDSRVTPADSGATATWTFTVPAGTYNLAASWQPQTDSTTSAQYTIGGVVQSVDQSVMPSDFWSAGVNWKRLTTIKSTGSPITVTLSGLPGATGSLIADSIRLEPATSTRARETNDTLATATEIAVHPGIPVTLSNYLGDGTKTLADIDLFKVTLAANQALQLHVDAQSPEFTTDASNLQSRIRIFNSSGLEVASKNSNGAIDADLNWVAPTAGAYYIGISSTENSAYDPATLATRVNNATRGAYLLHVTTPLTEAPSAFDHVYEVTSNGDGLTNGNITLRKAIQLANAAGGTSLIQFAATGNVVLTDGVLSISSNITLRGPVVGTAVTVMPSAGGFFGGELFNVATNGNLRLENMVLSGAYSTANGASVVVNGKLTLDQTEIRNSSSNLGGAIYVSSTGTAQLINSTLANNTATRGGAVYVELGGTMTAINTTFAQNDATLAGDAIVNAGVTSLYSSTIARNGLTTTNTTEAVQSIGGGRFTLRNTLITDNRSAADTSGPFVSNGFNLIGNGLNATGLQSNSSLRDQIGGQYGATVISGVVGELSLQGGRTRTILPVPGSPAIDRGSSVGLPSADQRGADRRLDGPDVGNMLDIQSQVDVGATEFGTYFVNVAHDAVDTSPSITDSVVDVDQSTSDVQISLRGAVRELSAMAGWTGIINQSTLNHFQGVIRFEPWVTEATLNRVGANENISVTGDLDIWGDIRVVGNNTPTIITADWRTFDFINGYRYFSLNDRAFHAIATSSLELDHIKLAGFSSPDASGADAGNGGAILNDGGSLTLNKSEVFFPYFHPTLSNGKLAGVKGGAIYARDGRTEIIDSHLFTNSAVDGGAIYNESGELLIDQAAIIEDNFAVGKGGAIYNQSGTVTITGQSVLQRNMANRFGGSLYNEPAGSVNVEGSSHIDFNTNRTSLIADGVAIYNLGAMAIREDSTVSNHSLFGGSALYNDGLLTLDHVTMARNTNTASASVIRNDKFGRLTWTHSVFTENGSPIPDPGAVVNDNGWVRIDDVMFNNNSIGSPETGMITNRGINADMMIHNSRFEYNHPSVEGGSPVIFNLSGNLVIDSSAFEYNYNTAGFYANSTAIKNLGVHEFIENRPQTLVDLVAEVSKEQTTVYVRNVQPFYDFTLPLNIMIGDERVKITAIDDFKQAITVERSKKVVHEVSDEVRLFIDETQKSIVVGDPAKYETYKLPFDILIDNEVMTVTAIHDDKIEVVRGRNNTIAAEHQFPVKVWAVSGGLQITNDVFADNHALSQLWPAGSETIFNWLHPHAPQTVIESTTFFNNSRFPAEILDTPNTTSSTTANIFANSADVRTFRGNFESLPEFSRTVFPTASLLSDGMWKDDTPSLVLENSVFDSRHALNAKQPPAIRGRFESAGGNFVDEADMNSVQTRTQLSTSGNSLIIATPNVKLPALPFLAQVGHTYQKTWQTETIWVTAAEEQRDPVTDEKLYLTKLTFQRAIGGTVPIVHPIGSLLSWGREGIWQESDRLGLPSFTAFSTEKISVVQPIAVGQTTLTIDDPTNFPPVPFNARILGQPTNQSEEPGPDGEPPEKLPDYEDITVTQVNAYELNVVRAKHGAPPMSFNAGVSLQYSWSVNTRLDAKLTRYTPVGETRSIVMPAPDSPLLNTGVNNGFSAHYATLASNLGSQNFVAQSKVIMAVAAGDFQSTTVGFHYDFEPKIKLADVSATPPIPFILRINDELLDVLAIDTATKQATVVRGSYGTTPHNIAPGAIVSFGTPITESVSQNRLMVEDASRLPTVPFSLYHGSEVLRVIAVDSNKNTIDVVRGALESTAVRHNVGTVFKGGESDFGTVQLNFQSLGTTDIQFAAVKATVELLEPITADQTVLRISKPSMPLSSLVGGTLKIGNEEMSISDARRINLNAQDAYITVVRGVRNTTAASAAKASVVDLVGYVITANPGFTSLRDFEYFRVDGNVWPVDKFQPLLPLSNSGISPVDSSMLNRTLIPVDESMFHELFDSTANEIDYRYASEKHTPFTGIYGIDIVPNTSDIIDINLTDTISLPQVPFTIRFGQERMLATAINPVAHNVTVTRAQQNTLQESHDYRSVPDHGVANIGGDQYAIDITAIMSVADGNFRATAVGYTFADETKIELSSLDGLPAVPFVLKINDELLDVKSVDSATKRVSVTRGAYGTEADAIDNGAPVRFGKPISAAATDKRFYVNDTRALPQPPFFLLHGTEIMQVDAVDASTNTINVTRGVQSSTPTSHAINTQLKGGFEDFGSTQLNFQASGTVAVKSIEVYTSVKLAEDIDDKQTTLYFKSLGDMALNGLVGGTVDNDGELMFVTGGTRPNANADGFFLTVIRGYQGRTPKFAKAGDSVNINGYALVSHQAFTPAQTPAYLRTEDYVWPLKDVIALGSSNIHARDTNIDLNRKLFVIDDTKVTSIASGNPNQFSLKAASTSHQIINGVYGVDVVADTPASIELNMSDVYHLPPVPFLIRLDQERMIATSVDLQNNNITVTRAVQGTAKQPHDYRSKPDQGTFVTITSDSHLPSETPFVAQIDNETLIVNSIDLSNHLLTVSRAIRGDRLGSQKVGQSLIWGNDTQSPGYNNVLVTLPVSVTSTDSQMTVYSESSLPDRFIFQVHSETIIANVVSRLADGRSVLSVVRGALGSVPASHAKGSNILMLSDAYSGYRNLDATIDVGAYEASTIRVNTTADQDDLFPGDGRVTTSVPGATSLRAAITEANATPGFTQIILPAGIYSFDSLKNALTISSSVEILGESVAATIIRADHSRAFDIGTNGKLRLVNLTVAGKANASAESSGFGGIVVNGGLVSLDRTIITESKFANGAAIELHGGQADIVNSTIYNNKATGLGGAIYSAQGKTNIQGSTISGNSADVGGAYWGDIASSLSVFSSTIATNSATSSGGVYSLSKNNQLGNALIAQNSATLVKSDLTGEFQSKGSNLIGIAPIPVLALAAPITTGNGTLTVVANPTPLPTLPFEIKIDAEVLKVTAINGTTWNILRGQQNTLYAAHAANAPIRLDGLWLSNDKAGTISTPIDPLLAALATTAVGTLPVHTLLPGSPAIDAGDGAQWKFLPTVRGSALNEIEITFEHPESLPAAPFLVMSNTEVRTVLQLTNNRAILNQPFNNLKPDFELQVLSDGRAAPRWFNPQSTVSIGSFVSPLGDVSLPGLDIGAYEAVPIVTLSSSTTSGTETLNGVTNYVFTLTRSVVTSGSLDVGYVVDGAGLHPTTGKDFVNGRIPFGTVHFGPGETTKTVTVGIQDDTVLENPEQFEFRLTTPSNVLMPVRKITASILPDADSIYFTATASETVEGGAIPVAITLHGAIEGGIWLLHNMNYNQTTSADFKPNDAENQLIGGQFFEGKDGEKSGFVLYTQQDSDVEPNEVFSINFSHPLTSQAASITVPTDVNSRIVNDDTTPPDAKIVISSVQSVETQKTQHFTVQLVGHTTSSVTAHIETIPLTASSQNFVMTSKDIVFAPDDQHIYEFDVTILNDASSPENHAFAVVASIANSNGQMIASESGRGLVFDKNSVNNREKLPQVCVADKGTRVAPVVFAKDLWAPKLKVTQTPHFFTSSLYLAQYDYQVNLSDGWLEVQIEVEEEVGTGDWVSNGHMKKCDDDDEKAVPPLLVNTIESEWVVPYTDSLTFNPFASFNHRLADNVEITVAKPDGSFATVGETVQLKMGSVKVNSDLTLTYSPKSNIDPTSFLPELDVFGNIMRFAMREPFTAHLFDKSKELSSDKLASQQVELTIANNLPALVGTTSHQLGAPQVMHAPGIIYLDAQELSGNEVSQRIDLRNLFTDDGKDLSKLRIVDIKYNTEKLDSGNDQVSPPIVDAHPTDIRVPVGTLTYSSNPSNPIKRNLVITKVDDYSFDLHNEVRLADIQSSLATWEYNLAAPTFMIEVTDGSKKEVIQKKPGTQEDEIKWIDHTWKIEVQTRVQNSKLTNSIWRNGLGIPTVETRPWISVVDASPLPNEPVQPLKYSVKTFTSADVRYNNVKSIGGVDVDVFTGDVTVEHPMLLDISGGNAELSLPGLVYDSSLIQESDGSRPVVYAVIGQLAGASLPTSISAKLSWYNDLTELPSDATVSITPLSDSTQHVVAVRPNVVPKDPGLYAWKLELTIGATTPTHITTFGELPVIVGDQVEVVDNTYPANPNGSMDEYTNPFGAGWMLAGVPNFIFDDRKTNDSQDDRILVQFPGQAVKIFDANFTTLYNFAYQGELPNIVAGASSFGTQPEDITKDPLEFGTLKEMGDKFVYTAADGSQYYANLVTMHTEDNTADPNTLKNDKKMLLIDKIEQAGVDFEPAGATGRRGLSFKWEHDNGAQPPVSYPHPILRSVKASDRSVTTFKYDTNYYVKQVLVGEEGGNAERVYDLTLDPTYDSAGKLKWMQLKKIVEQNALAAPVDGLTAENAVRAFTYTAEGLLSSEKWKSSSELVLSQTVMEFSPATKQLSKVTVGTLAPFDIEPAGRVGFPGNPTNLSKLEANIKQNATDLMKYTTSGPVNSSGESKSIYQFNELAQLIRTEDQFNSQKINETKYTYNLAGEVELAEQYVPGYAPRSTFTVQDYQLKAKYKTPQEEDGVVDDNTSPDDVISHYDPRDYRGNLVRVLSPSTYNVYMYETDNERRDAVGNQVHSIESGAISSAGAKKGAPNPPEPKGDNVKVITTYHREKDGLTRQIDRLRGLNFSSTEYFTYNVDDGSLESYKDPLGLLTEYIAYYPNGLPKDVKVTDSVAGQVNNLHYVYDVLGFPATATNKYGDNELISESTTVYDKLGNLRQEKLVDSKANVLSHNKYQFEYTDVAIEKTTDSKGTITENSYDVNGLLKNSKVADGLEYANKFTSSSTSVAQELDYVYYSDGSIRGVRDDVNDEILTRFYYEPGASLTTATGTQYYGTRSWTANYGVAGVADSAGLPKALEVGVDITETDGLGRVHLTDSVLQGGKTTYTYADPRLDTPTQIRKQQRAQGEHATAQDDKDLVVEKRYDNRGLLVYEKTGPLIGKAYGYDEIGALTSQAVLAKNGEQFYYLAGATGLPNMITEVRKEQPAPTKSNQYRRTQNYYFTVNSHDNHGRIVNSIDPTVGNSDEDAVASQTKRAYADGLLVSTNTDRLKVVTTTKTDPLGRVVESTDAMGTIRAYVYDSNGNLVSEKITPDTSQSANKDSKVIENSYVYDQHNRLRKQTLNGRTSYIDYFDTKADTAARWTITTTDHTGLVSATKLDSQGRVLAELEPAAVPPPPPPSPTPAPPPPPAPHISVYSYDWHPGDDTVSIEVVNTLSEVAKATTQMVVQLGYSDMVKTKQKVSVSGTVLKSERSGVNVPGYVTIERIEADSVGRTTKELLPPPTANPANTEFFAEYTYDDSKKETGTGNVASVKRPLTDVVLSFYDSAGQRLQSQQNSAATSSAENTFRDQYDALGRSTVNQIEPKASKPKSKIKDEATFKGRVTTVVDHTKTKTETLVDSPIGTVTENRFVPKVQNPSKASDYTVSTTENQYDFLGRLVKSTPPGRNATTYEYFPQGPVKKVTDGVGLTTSYTYDDYDRVLTVTDFSGGVTTNTYDKAGNLKTVQDPNLLTTTYNYDAENRLTSVVDAKGKITEYTYNRYGDRLTLKDPNGNITTWTYDEFNRVLTETNQLGAVKSYKYDEEGRVWEITKRDQNRIVIEFDSVGHKNEERWYSGTTLKETLTFVYDAIGTLLFAADSSTAVNLEYENGLLKEEALYLPSISPIKFASEYLGGSLASVTTNIGANTDSKISYSWTPDGLLEQIQQTGANVSNKSVKYSYDDAQRRKKVERFSDVGNSTSVFETVIEYAAAGGANQKGAGNKGRVASITHQRTSGSGSELAKYSDFAWDAGGRLSTIKSTADGTSNFSYDTVNQLTGVDYTNYSDLSFAYDDNGNRNNGNNVPGVDNRQESDATWNYQYDPNGNMTKKIRKSDNKEITYTYDIRNRLTDITDGTTSPSKKIHYAYDALDRRYLKTLDSNGDGTPETKEYYVNQGMRSDRGNAGDEVALQLDSSGNVKRRILHGALVDEVLAEEVVTSSTRETLWALTDQQGSVRDIAKVDNGTAAVVDHIMYDAFGNDIPDAAVDIDHMFGYTGREFDKETGLQYNRARFYDPKQGRWISQDPMSFEAGDANLYRYVGNGPTNGVDSSGLERSYLGWMYNQTILSWGFGKVLSDAEKAEEAAEQAKNIQRKKEAAEDLPFSLGAITPDEDGPEYPGFERRQIRRSQFLAKIAEEAARQNDPNGSMGARELTQYERFQQENFADIGRLKAIANPDDFVKVKIWELERQAAADYDYSRQSPIDKGLRQLSPQTDPHGGGVWNLLEAIGALAPGMNPQKRAAGATEHLGANPQPPKVPTQPPAQGNVVGVKPQPPILAHDTFLFRADSRAPSVAFRQGLLPQAGANESDVLGYARGSTTNSIFVGGSKSPHIAERFAKEKKVDYVYVVVARAQRSIDVNATLGNRTFKKNEHEVIVPYGFDSVDVVGYYKIVGDNRVFVPNPAFKPN